jgi:hypothetical protein
MSLDLEYYSSICDFEIVIDIPELQLIENSIVGIVLRKLRAYCPIATTRIKVCLIVNMTKQTYSFNY